MSVGDNPFVIELGRSPTTHISGKNGTGKSSLLVEGVFYALFGKSFRGLTLDMLMNNKNKKAMKVALEFERNGKQYVVTRGHKPKIFTIEVLVDGKLEALPENSKVGDLQATLESILGYDSAAFIKVVTIGHANYKSFLNLTAAERRAFVDYSLNTEIFTNMSKQAKKDLDGVKTSIQEKNQRLDVVRAIYNTKLAQIEAQKQSSDKEVEAFKLEIKQTLNMIEILQRQEEKIKQDLVPDVSSEIAEVKAEIVDLGIEARTIHYRIDRLQKEVNFFDSNTDCPSCKQNISHEHVSEIKSDRLAVIANLNESIAVIESKITALRLKETEYNTVINKNNETNQTLNNYRKEIAGLTQHATQVGKQLKALEIKEAAAIIDVDNEKIEIQALVQAIDELKKTQELYQKAIELLKDSGVKTAVISKYLPIFNQYVNQYLDILEFEERIRFDENFNEQFIGRYIGEKTYNSFSQGERERIDLALMFAWRSIIAISTGANTNLLVLDEIGGSSLDDDGIEGLFRIIDKICNDQNVFIISHRVEAKERCRSSIKLQKKDGFTRIVS